MSFRKEKKYRLTISDIRLLKSLLISQGMQILYPKRKINTCYFDTDSYTSEGNKQYHDMLGICESYYKIQERNY